MVVSSSLGPCSGIANPKDRAPYIKCTNSFPFLYNPSTLIASSHSACPTPEKL